MHMSQKWPEVCPCMWRLLGGLPCNNPQVETPIFDQLEGDDFNNISDILGSF